MRTLYETDKLIIEHEFEDAYLYDKISGIKLVHDDFYGDPECGLISINNDWAIIAGEHLTLWINGKINKIENDDLKWIHSIRVKGDYTVEILIDPWSDKSAIWELDLKTLKYIKLRDFSDYREKEPSDKIVW
jgi:hypothetical protein